MNLNEPELIAQHWLRSRKADMALSSVVLIRRAIRIVRGVEPPSG